MGLESRFFRNGSVYGAGQGGEYVHGNSNYSYTTVTFIRLAAT